VKFSFVAAEKAEFPVSRLCQRLGVSRSGFYASRTRPESKRAQEDRGLVALIHEAYALGRKTYGSPRIHRELRDTHDKCIGRNRVIRLMRAEGLRGIMRRRRVRTTDSAHNWPVAPNLLARDFQADGPNRRWAGDITYLRTKEGWLYLAVVLDLFSRKVVGWATSAMIDRHLVLKALNAAITQRCPGTGLLHHSDRGSQYASEDYQDALDAKGIVCSMSRRGDCYDNAVVESWFGTLKTELGDTFEDHATGNEDLFDYIEIFYNQRRRHSSLGYQSPANFERAAQQVLAA
jgi:transposase InsO family protein